MISENDQLLSHGESLREIGVEMMGIINKNGKLISSSGIDALHLPKDKKEMFFMKIALRNSMQRDFDEYFGPVNYCLTQRRNEKLITIPSRDEKSIFVITRKDIDAEKIVIRIKQILEYSKQILNKKNSSGMDQHE